MTQPNPSALEALQEDADLTRFNTFGVEARARYLLECHSVEQLRAGVEFARDNRLGLLVLGEGSNVLFVNDYPGLVLVNRLKGIVLEGESTFRVAAGESWHALVEWSLSKGLYGLENLALIPGTVGAAPIQNIGAYGVEVERFIQRVVVFDTELAQEVIFDKADCGFAYRDSVFKRARRGRYLVIEVEFELLTRASPVLSYAPLAERFGAAAATPRQVFDAVCEIRRSKLPDPRLVGNAGSFFKNPIVSASKVESLRGQGSDVPAYATDEEGLFKVPAAWLLEAAGWKGKVRGRAAVYDAHSLVLVNLGDASGEEIYLLAQEMASSVLQRFGIALQTEVLLV